MIAQWKTIAVAGVMGVSYATAAFPSVPAAGKADHTAAPNPGGYVHKIGGFAEYYEFANPAVLTQSAERYRSKASAQDRLYGFYRAYLGVQEPNGIAVSNDNTLSLGADESGWGFYTAAFSPLVDTVDSVGTSPAAVKTAFAFQTSSEEAAAEELAAAFANPPYNSLTKTAGVAKTPTEGTAKGPDEKADGEPNQIAVSAPTAAWLFFTGIVGFGLAASRRRA